MKLTAQEAKAEIRAVLKRGANLDVGDVDGDTLLHLAVHYDLPDEARKLMGAGAKSAIKNNDGYTPRRLALHLGNQRLLEIFTRRRAYARYKENLRHQSDFRQSVASVVSAVTGTSTCASGARTEAEDGLSILSGERVGKHTTMWDVKSDAIFDDFMQWTEATHVAQLRVLVSSIRQQEADIKSDLAKLKARKYATLSMLKEDIFEELRVHEHALCLRIWNAMATERKARRDMHRNAEIVGFLKDAVETAGDRVLWSGKAKMKWWTFVWKRWSTVHLSVTGSNLKIMVPSKGPRGQVTYTLPLDQLCRVEMGASTVTEDGVQRRHFSISCLEPRSMPPAPSAPPDVPTTPSGVPPLGANSSSPPITRPPPSGSEELAVRTFYLSVDEDQPEASMGYVKDQRWIPKSNSVDDEPASPISSATTVTTTTVSSSSLATTAPCREASDALCEAILFATHYRLRIRTVAVPHSPLFRTSRVRVVQKWDGFDTAVLANKPRTVAYTPNSYLNGGGSSAHTSGDWLTSEGSHMPGAGQRYESKMSSWSVDVSSAAADDDDDNDSDAQAEDEQVHDKPKVKCVPSREDILCSVMEEPAIAAPHPAASVHFSTHDTAIGTGAAAASNADNRAIYRAHTLDLRDQENVTRAPPRVGTVSWQLPGAVSLDMSAASDGTDASSELQMPDCMGMSLYMVDKMLGRARQTRSYVNMQLLGAITLREKLLERVHYLQALKKVARHPPPSPTRSLGKVQMPSIENAMAICEDYVRKLDELEQQSSIIYDDDGMDVNENGDGDRTHGRDEGRWMAEESAQGRQQQQHHRGEDVDASQCIVDRRMSSSFLSICGSVLSTHEIEREKSESFALSMLAQTEGGVSRPVSGSSQRSSNLASMIVRLDSSRSILQDTSSFVLHGVCESAEQNNPTDVKNHDGEEDDGLKPLPLIRGMSAQSGCSERSMRSGSGDGAIDGAIDDSMDEVHHHVGSVVSGSHQAGGNLIINYDHDSACDSEMDGESFGGSFGAPSDGGGGGEYMEGLLDDWSFGDTRDSDGTSQGSDDGSERWDIDVGVGRSSTLVDQEDTHHFYRHRDGDDGGDGDGGDGDEQKQRRQQQNIESPNEGRLSGQELDLEVGKEQGGGDYDEEDEHGDQQQQQQPQPQELEFSLTLADVDYDDIDTSTMLNTAGMNVHYLRQRYLGAPPKDLVKEFEMVLGALERLWLCELQTFETIQRFTATLHQREHTWQQLKFYEERLSTTSFKVPEKSELYDIAI